MKSLFRLGASFFFELIILLIDFMKCFFWTIFYVVWSPTEKYVRNEIVLVTGSAKGLGICIFSIEKLGLQLNAIALTWLKHYKRQTIGVGVC